MCVCCGGGNADHDVNGPLQTLLKLSENILEHPDEEKYQKFRLENPTIKRILKEPKGTLEYARAVCDLSAEVLVTLMFICVVPFTAWIQPRGELCIYLPSLM